MNAFCPRRVLEPNGNFLPVCELGRRGLKPTPEPSLAGGETSAARDQNGPVHVI
jgi:hypothetical protein